MPSAAGGRPDCGRVGAEVRAWAPKTTAAGRLLVSAAGAVSAALSSVFLLDPVPHLMRQYVPRRDVELRRGADNLSAVVAHLRESRPGGGFQRLEQLVAGMPEFTVQAIDQVTTGLGDVQLVLMEAGYHGRVHEVPARLLSDGMLRFLAFGTALLDEPETPVAERLLVIEEIENGLYPTQAARVLDLVREESRNRAVDVLFTTHSPALLNSLTAEDHPGVIVCTRDPESGESVLSRLTDLPGYVDLLAAGDLGDAVSKGRLSDALASHRPDASSVEEFLRNL
ncbi:AAA family ATPase [Actinacidiphila yeochonensis]|uniref:AAA family ATPase n=1 Tax=Actinacidiphila yeochonensis TaxID=89050 RepID=UPI00068A4C7C|nr:ATP-binding protein [Actinacidiphila yeochonensis]